MKGLSIEQKAKRYDEAFERVWELLSRCKNNRDRRTMVYRVEDIESIFPELKKNEDEKIKEDLIQWISDFPDMIWSGHYREDVITWLKKQGNKDSQVKLPTFTFDDILALQCCMETVKKVQNDKDLYEKLNDLHGRVYDAYHLEKQEGQKSIYDVKPKFKVGDWICNDMCDVHIASIEDGMYYFDEGDGLSIVFVDEHYHLWTIEDAMDGDVLTWDDTTCVVLFKNIKNNNCFISYCFANDISFEIGVSHYIEDCHPATKEQRDLLFQKMEEAGYEWDSQKKELKIIDWSKHIKYEPNSPSIIEENTTWSEEDEDHLNSLIELLPGLTIRHNWLKSLKDRIQQQPKQEWSEEDERICQCLIQDQEDALDEVRNDKYGHSEIISDLKEMYRERIDWLKSLRPHKQWKPSEEQMDALETAVSSIQSNTLETLYQDLKREKNYE